VKQHYSHGAGHIVVNEVVERAPCSSVQVLIVHLKLLTQQEAAVFIVIRPMQLVCYLIELVQQPFGVQQLCELCGDLLKSDCKALYKGCIHRVYNAAFMIGP
jgi:hypothetical protein